MNDSVSVVAAQAQAMIARLRRYESEQIGDILDGGHAAAHAAVRAAFRAARASVARAVQRERARRQAAAITAQARAETRLRLDAQLQIGQLLAAGWEQLPGVLMQRWLDPEKRRLWWQAAIAQARQRLLSDQYLVEYAPGPSTEELKSMTAACSGSQVSLQSEPTLKAGVRISTPGAVLDASVASLLADREHIQSLLLAAYQSTESHGKDRDA
jgi:hypothetical protein